ncbi:MAG: helicase, superfamily [Planctomycetota bacterium]|nr:helicase, superfamily [Planctomycetota bacterium]
MQTTTQTTETPSGFTKLGLSEVTLLALERAGFQTPSPVQTHLIPPAMLGRDCLGNAPTGTGKTAAFLVPIIEKLDDRERGVQALILVPTRELAHQIGREFETLSHGRRLRAAAIVGGESMFKQIKLLQSGCQIVIATPGRLMDLMDRNAIRLDKARFVVLDEADQMLDIGFRPAVESIMDACPTPRQTFLLSATMPREVRDLTRRYLVDPADVRLIHEDEDATIPAIRQAFVMVAPERKLELLFRLLEREQPTRAIVFCRTKHGADKVGNLLRNDGFKAEAMHGDLSQGQRNRVLAAFRSGRLTTLVATDVVGRGIDVPGISHVVNFDIPEDPEHYVHRIGRTGRMGKDGAAFTFILPDQGKLLDQIEKSISRRLDQDQVEGVPTLLRPMTAPKRGQQGRPFQGGGRGRRMAPAAPQHRRGQGLPVGSGIRRKRSNSPQRTS